MNNGKCTKTLKQLAANVTVLLICALALFPLVWIFVTACKSQNEILKESLRLFPREFSLWQNISEVLRRADWGRYYLNTVALTAGILAAQLVIAIPAAYAFATMKFKGAKLLFALVLMRLMVSPESTMLANYTTVLSMNGYDTYFGIAVPYLVSAMAIMMFRQGFKQIPKPFYESAQIEGCTDFQYLWRVGVPMIRPQLLSFSIITCVFQWNTFFWPMLITESKSKRVISIALTYFGLQAESASEWGLTMAAALLVAVPLLAVFVVFQKQFINSFVHSGLK